ncbi:MAG: hypothetical protein H6730_10235 [Deltaproteobacteria bacterium]|nr:hypothetical protein [Deltaproteobacteria bacterium]
MRRGVILLVLALAACSEEQQVCSELPASSPSLVSWRQWQVDPLRADPAGQAEGPATVRRLEPFELVFDAGWSWSLEVEPPSIPVGARVYAKVEVGDHGGGALAVWALCEGGAPGNLAFAAWTGWKYTRQGFGDVGYVLEPSDRLVCRVCSQTLRVVDYRFSGTGIESGLADGGTFGPYRFTGYAWVEESPPRGACFDVDRGPFQIGRLERADLEFEVVTPPIDCSALDPGDCPAHSECSLFGGDGVPITCQRTLVGCERKDQDACVTDPGCVWRDGAAGVSGVCRQACTTRTWGFGCTYETQRFCQALDEVDEACAVGAPGFCERRPGNDCSEDQPEVCACQPGYGWVLVPACVRAESGYGFVRTATACAM